MTRALVNATIVAGDGVLAGHAVLLDGERILAIVPREAVPPGMPCENLAGGTLLPGFLDVQVNGGGGLLFNDRPDVETIRAIGRAHANFGTTGFLPTLISADFPTIRKAIDAVDAAIAAKVPGVLGIHIEGPFLSPARKGIHDAANFRKLDDDGFALITSLKRGKTLVTLAPEETTLEMIGRLAKTGVIVSAGHSNSDYETARRALKNGIRGVTHLFNAMSQFGSRAPGLVGAALEDNDVWCGIIADGHHVHPASLRVALACKGKNRLMLVTDAMPGVGSDRTTFKLQGNTISVTDGIATGPDGTLAGSNLDMETSFHNARAFLDLDLATASRLASANAADFLGIAGETGRIAPDLRADLVLLSDTGHVRQTWIGGQPQLPLEKPGIMAQTPLENLPANS